MTEQQSGVVVFGPGRLKRCEWVREDDPALTRYHDIEWATATHSPAALFETLTLGVFQAGLGWLTVFHKRDAFREAFKGFEPEEVARMAAKDVELLLGNKGIIRNRAKIEATVHNARLVADAKNSLDSLAWAVVPGRHPRPRRWADVPSSSPDSVILSKALRAAGYRFVGPTSVYSFMQTVGIVDDHLVGCFRARLEFTCHRPVPAPAFPPPTSSPSTTPHPGPRAPGHAPTPPAGQHTQDRTTRLPLAAARPRPQQRLP
jgi:DNA-3-methyladenine glycosylase I